MPNKSKRGKAASLVSVDAATRKHADEIAAQATADAATKRDAIAKAATNPTAAQIDATRKPDSKPVAAKPTATTADKPKPAPKPSHYDNGTFAGYTGASKPVRSGHRLSPVMLTKACNGLSDRTRLAMLDLRDAYGSKPFSRLNFDAGILGFLCYLGYAEYVDNGERFTRDGNEFVRGDAARFQLTASAIDYGKAATKR